ncbi:hypothetical protein DYB34_004321 [Aphanomyces astaci]|uniref:Vacuolar protein sorting-associated protein 13 VPS13 adaptor binding domain-containing protein n=1 Tax=Aphanomyces astaci TaxID=112090 RepID=A0A3R7A1U5_APHAT|nr:hypothetical protein DYB34_004321 [Aphanomyces astaci]
MKAPLVVLPEDPTAVHTSMVVLDLGRFHVRDVPTAAASATVYAWQIDMTNIEVLLQPQNSSKPGVPIVPGFSVGFAVETSRNLQDTRIPYVTAKASMPSVVVNVGQETIVALGTLHARLLNQCQRYIKATSKPEVDMASFAPEKGDVEKATDLSVVRLPTVIAPQEQASVKFHLTWVVECVHVNIDDSFCVIMHGTWFDYQASSAATTTIGAKLQDLCMEDKCYAPSSPYFYLARTQDSTDLIQLTIATTDAPTRHADVTVDVHFNVLHLQWNPPSIMMLYTMISAYGSSMDDGASADMMVDMSSSSVLSQSTLPTPTTTSTTSTIPALKITASLKQFSISFNKDVLDRRLLTLTVTDASVVYVGEHSGQYNVKGELGDVSGVDYSVVKAPTYTPFFGMDRTAHGCFKQEEQGRSPKLVVFEYAVQGSGAMLPRLALVLDSIRIVYFHQQVLELVDYLFQGILGTLVNQTLLSATQLIMEPATTLILDIRIDRPKILIPMDPLDVEHFLLQSSRLQVHHTPTTLASYCCGSSLLERVTTATSHTLPCDFKKVVLEQAGLYSTDGRGGDDNLMATPLTLDISILDIHSTRLKDDDGSTALPRFSIDCVMPHMHVHMSRTHYLMFFRMLSDNIGGASLYQSVAVDNDEDMIMAKSEMAHRPVVVYEYANADLEGATMTVSFRMESFSCCALDIGLTLETTNLTVCLRLLNHINPSLDVSLANAFISDDLLRCESVVTIRYEWSNANDDAGLLLGTSSTLDVALNHLHGKLIPHVLSDISRFFAMDADATAVHDEGTTTPCSEPTAQSLAKTPTSFTMNVLATNVQLSLPQSLTDKQPTVELVVAANFNVALESFANHADNLDQKLTVQARDLEALLQNANRQGCSDTLVQLIEPTTVGVTYLGFQHACHHQDKVDVTVSPVEVFLSYEDMRVLADVWTTMHHDMAPAFPSSGPTSATTLSSSKTLPLVPDSEVQRHVTVDVQRMQLTLINDCDGCDMGLVQLELPTCRVFLNATTTHDATTATGGGDISFASSYYNPDSRVWHPLCPEWKVHASAMTNIPHAPTTDQFKSMQWNISADTLHVTATHGLLEALASAGGTLIKSKQLDQTKHDAPCLIKNESGLPIEYWWSSDPSAKTRKGSGVTRTYTSNDKEHGTLCINFVGMDTKPVQGIVVDQLGTRPHALVETCGSFPIPIDATSTSTIRVTCTNESKVAVFCVALANGLIQLYEPYVVENKLPVSVMFQVKDAQSLPRGDDVAVGCKSAIWWCRSTPMFAFHVPGCDTTNWLPLLRKRNNDTFSLGLKRLDKQPLTILVVISENKAKATTITLLAEMWIINKTGLDLVYGNDQDDAYSPPKAARSVVDGSTDITLYSTPTTLRVKMMAPASSWTARFKPDPKRMNWQDECLSVTTRQGKLHEFGVSADYATRHFGVLTTLVSITPRYVVVNRTPWTLVVLEDDGLMHTIDTVHHVINAGDAYSLWWTQGKRTAIRASVVGLNGTSSWSDSFSVDKPNTFDLIIPNDEYCPFLQVSVKTGGLSQATFVVDIVRLDSEPDVEQSKWDIISYDINVAGLDLTLSDSTKATSPAFELFGGTGVMSEDVARFRISDIRFDSFKDRLSTNAHLVVASITLEDLLVGTKYPNVLTPAKRDVDFVQFTYMSKRHPKYAYIEELTLWTKDVRVQTSMKFIDRINSVVAHVLGHFASSNTYSVDLLSYFADDSAGTEQQQHNTITGRKCFFERCHIYPINVVLSFVRDKKDDRMDHPSAGFWLSNLKFRIKDASIVLDEYTLRNAFATQESVLQAMGAFYVSSIKGQALNLIESIQVTSLVTGVVKDGVSSLVSTLIGKTDTSLASSASFRYESLSNNAIVAKHSDALDKATSPTDFAGVLNHLVYDWDGNHTGLEARACMALGLVNNSRQSVVLQVFLKDGAEFRLLPAGRNYVAGASSPYWTSDRGLIVFAWGYTPTLLTTGDICLQLQSNAFNLYISKSSTRLQPNPGYSATFTVQDKQTWWSKFMIIVGDDLPPSLEVSSTTSTTSTTGGVIDTYEVLFTTDALGIVAKQDDYQTVVVRECCYFSNGQPGPALATGRITEGDVILSVNGIPIKSTQAFKDIIVNTSRPIVVRFKKASFDLFGEVTPSPAAHKPDHEYSLFG